MPLPGAGAGGRGQRTDGGLPGPAPSETSEPGGASTPQPSPSSQGGQASLARTHTPRRSCHPGTEARRPRGRARGKPRVTGRPACQTGRLGNVVRSTVHSGCSGLDPCPAHPPASFPGAGPTEVHPDWPQKLTVLLRAPGSRAVLQETLQCPPAHPIPRVISDTDRRGILWNLRLQRSQDQRAGGKQALWDKTLQAWLASQLLVILASCPCQAITPTNGCEDPGVLGGSARRGSLTAPSPGSQSPSSRTLVLRAGFPLENR
nr:uncharacterized protein LOC108388602 [Manis javanica]